MNTRKFFRNLARLWMGSVLFTDMVGYVLMLIDPNSPIYDLAHSMNWMIDPTWAAVSFPVVIAMCWLSFDVIFHNRPMGAMLYGFLTIISTLWGITLLIYEPFVLDSYHWTKVIDGIRWMLFAYAAWYYKFRSSPWS